MTFAPVVFWQAKPRRVCFQTADLLAAMQSDWPQAERAELLALFGVPRAILPMVPGHADGGNVGGACAGIAPRTAPGFDGRRPQILRLVLDLAAGGNSAASRD